VGQRTVPSAPTTAATPRARSSSLRAALRALCLTSLALGASACERGCLSAWVGAPAPGPGGDGRRGSPAEHDAGPAFDLLGTDCSDGLARCLGGRVEASVSAHLPHPCVPREGRAACECPWREVGACESGCVVEGLVVIAPAASARAQLCTSANPVLRPPLPSELSVAPICADASASCADGLVRWCPAAGQPSRVVAACLHGCAGGVALDPDDLIHAEASALLCRRGP
jgi:hypothetical protein